MLIYSGAMSDTHVDLEVKDGPARPLLVAQLSDLHLDAQYGGQLAGMDADASMACVLELLRAAPRLPDLLLLTGDLASNGASAAYSRVREAVDCIGVPWFWLPGNHDVVAEMRVRLADGRPMVRSIRAGTWRILMLDSTVPGAVGGRLGEAELALLAGLLAEDSHSHTLLCLHHQPVPVGCAWLDEQRLADADELFAVIAGHPCVKAVLWGHVHQEFAARRDGLLLLAAPSACIQFAPGSAGFRLDDCAPGMRWLELYGDGHIETRVERVHGECPGFDRDSRGYL